MRLIDRRSATLGLLLAGYAGYYVCRSNLPVGQVMIGDDQIDADRTEHALERHPHVAEIGLVIAHPDRVPGVAIHHRDRDFALRDL